MYIILFNLKFKILTLQASNQFDLKNKIYKRLALAVGTSNLNELQATDLKVHYQYQKTDKYYLLRDL